MHINGNFILTIHILLIDKCDSIYLPFTWYYKHQLQLYNKQLFNKRL